MTFFMGVLAYLIVKYKAFNIKLAATQALMVTLDILIGSQLFFIKTTVNRVLTGVTLVMALVLGYWLVSSVKKEIEQKEQLAEANVKIEDQNTQLESANIKLKQLDQSKTDFINIAAHQLRKAPTPIKGYVSMLLDGSYGPIEQKIKDTLNIIYTANQRQIDLVDDLLNVARMESGKIQLDFKEQAIEEICQNVYDNLINTAKDKGLTLTYEKPKKAMPKLMIDKGKMFEAVNNFVDNAVKYTDKGGVTLKLELGKVSKFKKTDPEDKKPAIIGPVVRVTVADTGMGIPATELPYLFAKFSRGKDVSRLHVEGTGLGLYVVKLMVEAHGGRTWAESDGDGKGSRFIIELPVKKD